MIRALRANDYQLAVIEKNNQRCNCKNRYKQTRRKTHHERSFVIKLSVSVKAIPSTYCPLRAKCCAKSSDAPVPYYKLSLFKNHNRVYRNRAIASEIRPNRHMLSNSSMQEPMWQNWGAFIETLSKQNWKHSCSIESQRKNVATFHLSCLRQSGILTDRV